MLLHTDFLPMLAPNEQLPIDKLPYPLLVSWKINGIRCILHNGIPYTRHLKLVPNRNVELLLDTLGKFTRSENLLLDGELYSKSLLFDDFSGIVRSHYHSLPADFTYYLFDSLIYRTTGFDYETNFLLRNHRLTMCGHFPHVEVIPQILVANPEEITKMLEAAVGWGCDGLIARSSKAYYKTGRGTLNQGLIFKVKPYTFFYSKVVGVQQATVVREGSERKINEMGYSVTSKKKEDRVLIESASAFLIKYKGKEMRIPIAAPAQVRKSIWASQDQYLNTVIMWKGFMFGIKEDGLPRSPELVKCLPTVKIGVLNGLDTATVVPSVSGEGKITS